MWTRRADSCWPVIRGVEASEPLPEARSPCDLSAREVLADQLMEAGDPRGDFIAAQCALARRDTPAERVQAACRTQWSLLEKHGESWFGHPRPALDHRVHALVAGFVYTDPLPLHEAHCAQPQHCLYRHISPLDAWETRALDSLKNLGSWARPDRATSPLPPSSYQFRGHSLHTENLPPGLRALALRGVKQVIGPLPSTLRHVELSDPIEAPLIERLGALPELRSLILRGTPPDVAPSKAGFRSLEHLTISGGARVTLIAFLPLPHLTHLRIQTSTLAHNGGGGLGGFQGLTALEFLDLSDTTAWDLEPISRLSKLRSLRIANTDMIEISPLARNTSLQNLDLSFTRVRDFQPIAQIPSLRRVVVGGETQLRRRRGLAQLKKRRPDIELCQTT